MNGAEILALMYKQPVPLRGRLSEKALLADVTWFRVGGPAEVLFSPADEDDLAVFLRVLPAGVPVAVVGLGSNLLVRDGGIDGVVVRLGKGFAGIKTEPGHRLRSGTAVPDQRLAKAAADAGIAGLAFYRGIPGALGGALRMNAGAHGTDFRAQRRPGPERPFVGHRRRHSLRLSGNSIHRRQDGEGDVV